MDNTQCGGQELEISECRFDSWGENDCDSSEAAGVVCESLEPQKPKINSVPAMSVAIKKVIQKYRIKVISIFYISIHVYIILIIKLVILDCIKTYFKQYTF